MEEGDRGGRGRRRKWGRGGGLKRWRTCLGSYWDLSILRKEEMGLAGFALPGIFLLLPTHCCLLVKVLGLERRPITEEAIREKKKETAFGLPQTLPASVSQFPI